MLELGIMKKPRILVPLDDSDHCITAIAVAGALAKHAGSRVTGLSVFSPELISSSVAPVSYYGVAMVADTIQDAISQCREALEHRKGGFEAYCHEYGVDFEEHDLTGIPSTSVLEEARMHDLVVTGTRQNFIGGGVSETSLLKILKHAVTPVLAVPKGPTKPLRKVAIAYDGSMPSVRAMKDFVNLINAFGDLDSVHVVVANEDVQVTKTLLKEATDYLAAHGVENVHGIQLLQKKLCPSELSDRVSPDLVVAGIHSNNFMKDLVVGSFMKRLLETEACAVLMSH